MHARARTPPRTASVAPARRRRARRRAGVRVGRLAAVGRRPPRPPRRADSAAAVDRRAGPARRCPITPRVLIFGDSWVYGSAAIVPTLGFAYLLGESEGWDTIVDGVRGSGYLKPGLDGGSYRERIAALDPALDPDLIIVEGSINDRRLPADGIPGCRHRRLGRARSPLSRAPDRDPRPRAAGAARSRRPPRASTPTSSRARRAARLVVHLADRRGLDHRRPTTSTSSTPASARTTRPRTATPTSRSGSPSRSRRSRTGTDVAADAPHDEELVGP